MTFRFCDELGPDGFGWLVEETMTRTSHALAADGRVWLVDALDWPEAIDRALGLGEPAGVIQLLDRHNRDCAPLAQRLRVPLHVVPDDLPNTPFECIPIMRRRFWRESALWHDWDVEAAEAHVRDALVLEEHHAEATMCRAFCYNARCLKQETLATAAAAVHIDPITAGTRLCSRSPASSSGRCRGRTDVLRCMPRADDLGGAGEPGLGSRQPFLPGRRHGASQYGRVRV